MSSHADTPSFLDPRAIFLFLHVPKTGGTTINQHLVEHFSEIASVRCEAGDPRFASFERARAELGSLSSERQERIRYVFGHLAYAGMCSSLDRPTFTFLFLRDPVAHAMSLYNFYCTERAIGINPDDAKLVENDRGDLLPFSDWISYPSPWHSYAPFLHRCLLGAPLDPGQEEAAAPAILAALERLDFVGITEREDDFRFILGLLGVRQFFPRQNVSDRFVGELDADTVSWIRKRRALDCDFYSRALELNTMQRQNMPYYDQAVANSRAREGDVAAQPPALLSHHLPGNMG